MANYFDSDTHSLTELAAFIAIAHHTGTGDIGNAEAVERLRRLEALARARKAGLNVQVKTLSEAAQILWEGDETMNDVADCADLVEERREALEEKSNAIWDAMHPPTNGRTMTAQGVEPGAVADVLYPVKDVQDDSLPWSVPWNEASDVADDGEPVAEWDGMYDD